MLEISASRHHFAPVVQTVGRLPCKQDVGDSTSSGGSILFIGMSKSIRHGKYARHRQQPSRYWHWLWSEPKEWRRMMKHKKRRQSCRQCAHAVMVGHEDVLWPLDRKPWIYYY